MVENVVITCADADMQLPIISYTEKQFGILQTYLFTVAKPSYLIAEKRDSKKVKKLLEDISVLMLKNSPKTIALVAHDNHENETEQTQMIFLNTAVQFLSELYPCIEVVGLWIDSRGIVQEVTRLANLSTQE